MEQILYRGAIFDIRIPITERKHYVYALLDDHGNAFYVGYSSHPVSRAFQHLGDNQNANSYHVLKDIRRPQMAILSVHDSKEEALTKEESYILRHPHLLNHPRPREAPVRRGGPGVRTHRFFTQRNI